MIFLIFDCKSAECLPLKLQMLCFECSTVLRYGFDLEKNIWTKLTIFGFLLDILNIYLIQCHLLNPMLFKPLLNFIIYSILRMPMMLSLVFLLK